jgi:hypothetical protein
MELAGHGKDPRLVQAELPIAAKPKARRKPSLPKGIKVGDMVTYLDDGTIGKVTSLSDRHINIKTTDGVQSHNLELSAPKLEIHDHPNRSVVFAIGDRVTLCSKTYDVSERFGTAATVIEKKWDKKIKCTRIKVQYDDGYIYPCIEGSGWFKKLEEENKCLPISIISEESEHSPLQPKTLKKSQQSPTSTSTKTRKKSINPTSKKSQYIPTSETIPHREELTSLQEDSLAQEQAPQVQKQDSITKSLNSGLNISDVSEKDSPDLQLSKIPQDYSIAEWEQSYKAYPKAGTMQSGKLSVLPCLEVPKGVKEFLSLPTLMTGLGKGRNAGATKCEKFLKDKGILPNTHSLSPQMMALLFNFPPNWTECLWESPKEAEEGTTSENSSGAQSMSTVPPSHSNEFSTYTEFSQNNIDAKSDFPLERLAFLQSERDRLIASGASPKGIWLEKSKPSGKDFVQVVWKSDKARPEWGDRKSKYIGKENSDEHLSAIAQHLAGQKLRKIEREIKELSK